MIVLGLLSIPALAGAAAFFLKADPARRVWQERVSR